MSEHGQHEANPEAAGAVDCARGEERVAVREMAYSPSQTGGVAFSYLVAMNAMAFACAGHAIADMLHEVKLEHPDG